MGFQIVATEGTRRVLQEYGLEIDLILKLHEGRPHVIDWIKNQQVHLILNTPSSEEARADGRLIRRTALAYKIPIVTTLAAARATAAAIRSLKNGADATVGVTSLQVKALQEYSAHK
jgi:carbamoyl-phosphate synthase large subunit